MGVLGVPSMHTAHPNIVCRVCVDHCCAPVACIHGRRLIGNELFAQGRYREAMSKYAVVSVLPYCCDECTAVVSALV